MGGPSSCSGRSIALDDSGNIYVTGVFIGVADFDPGQETFFLSSAGSNDIFVQKLDSDGNFIWAKRMGGPQSDSGSSIRVDASGNVYTTGYFHSTVDFDPGSETFNLVSTGYSDVFIQKLDTDGNFLWVKKMGGSSYDEGHSIALDAAGNVYTTGFFTGIFYFAVEVGTGYVTSAGSKDIFIHKLDADGNFIWIRKMGGSSEDIGHSIAVDSAGDIYTTGFFKTTADFDPGEGTANLTSAGQSDVFILKLDTDGNFLWVEQIAGTQENIGLSITVDDASANVYTTGYFVGKADFNPGAQTTLLTSAGNHDVFVQKLHQCYTLDPVPDVANLSDITAECEITAPAVPAPTGTDDCGGAITGTTTATFPITTQGTTTITWTYDDGHGNTATQTQDVVITDITGPVPDVTDLPDLTAMCEILASDAPAPMATDNCAGAITATTTAIFPITMQGTTTITWTYDDGNGNVATQNQAINWTPVDVTTSLVGDNTITANNENGTYQWIDCDNNNTPISGEINQSFTASANGNYAVEITQNGCVNTSECVSITTVGISEIEQGIKVTLYPNPSSGIFHIAFEKPVTHAVLTVADIQGKQVSQTQIQNTSKASIEIKEPSGIYLLTIKSKDGQKIVQLIKE